MKTTKEVTLKWIDVNEKLPEENGYCLVTMCEGENANTYVDSSFYSGNGIFNCIAADEYVVTHWMSFPPPAFSYEII